MQTDSNLPVHSALVAQQGVLVERYSAYIQHVGTIDTVLRNSAQAAPSSEVTAAIAALTALASELDRTQRAGTAFLESANINLRQLDAVTDALSAAKAINVVDALIADPKRLQELLEKEKDQENLREKTQARTELAKQALETFLAP